MGAIEAVKEDPANGKLTFRVNTNWTGGFKAKHSTSDYAVGPEKGKRPSPHTVNTDEPHEVLGSDTGISPAETLITSLAACLTVGYAANAAAMGIDLDDLSFEITGNGSLEGFMDIGDARPGLSDLSIKAIVKSNAPEEKLQELHDHVNNHSPIWDTICNPVQISSSIVTG
jgi:uncharacterized OsmC-like protein